MSRRGPARQRTDDGERQLEAMRLWTETLTGLSPARQAAAQEAVVGWQLPHVSEALSGQTVDACVATTLLVEGVERLVDRGVDEQQLIKKLRNDRGVWPTWAEIRAADIALHWYDESVRASLEPGRSEGAHPDLRIEAADGSEGESCEVKSVGFSDTEMAFLQRMALALDDYLPAAGVVNIQAPIDAEVPTIPRDQRRHGHREARRLAKRNRAYPRGVRGISIVGHGSEPTYALRASRRIEQATRQLPEGDECWVAILWTNGAPIEQIVDIVRWERIPERVAGLWILGSCVAFPYPQIHNFMSVIPRDGERPGEREVHSLEEGQDDLAGVILAGFERSSGVRATLVKGGKQTLIHRNGDQRFYPFNFMLDPDPPWSDREAAVKPWELVDDAVTDQRLSVPGPASRALDRDRRL